MKKLTGTVNKRRKHSRCVCAALAGMVSLCLLGACGTMEGETTKIEYLENNELTEKGTQIEPMPTDTETLRPQESMEEQNTEAQAGPDEQQTTTKQEAPQGEQEIPKEQQMPQEQQTPEPEPIVEPIEFKGSQELKEKYRAILLGEEEFIKVSSGEKVNIKEIKKVVSDEEQLTAKTIKFIVIDLDGDEEDELVLWIEVNGHLDWGFVIIHKRDKDIYGVVLPYRGFKELKKDGTFTYSGGSAYSGTGRLKFVDTGRAGYETIELESEGQMAKPDAVWYDLTLENIELAFGS